MRDHCLGGAVAQHVADLGRLAVPIDRHAIGTEHLHGIARLEEREIIAQYQRDRLACSDAERGKAARRPQGAAHQGFKGNLTFAADYPAAG